MWSDILPIISNYIALSAIIPISLFIYFYGTVPVPGKRFRRKWTTRRWASTSIGRTLMAQKIAWGGYLLFVAASLFFGEFLFREELRFLIYTALVTLFWVVFAILRKLQKSTDVAYAKDDVERKVLEDALRAEEAASTRDIPVNPENPDTRKE